MTHRSWLPLALIPLFITLLCASTPGLTQTVYLEITDPAFFPTSPSQIPAVQTFRWQTDSAGSDPAEVRHILVNAASFGNSFTAALYYIQSAPSAPEWSSWSPFGGGMGTSWTSPTLNTGNYVFAVQGRDASGVTESIESLRNAIFVRYAPHETGPLLTVTSDLMDPVTGNSTSTPITYVTATPGVANTFCWTATAAAYGGTVTGYRYGWDIVDPDDPDALWEIEFTPLPTEGACSLPRTFYFGQHNIIVEVIDNTFVKSRVPIVLNLSPVAVEPSTWGAVKALYR